MDAGTLAPARTAQDRHAAQQALIGLVINSALSLGFALLAAHARTALPLWGARGMAFDFVPQFFMIIFATSLAVTLATRKAVRAGRLPARQRPTRLPRTAALRALLLAFCGALLLTPLAAGAMIVAGVASLTAPVFIGMKIIVGGLLGATVAVAVARLTLKA